MKKVKVLYLLDRLRWGGIQSLLYDIITYNDWNKCQIDVITMDDGVHYDLEDELKSKGVTIYKLNNIWIKTPLDYYRYIKAMNSFFKEHHNYDVVHLNSSYKHAPFLYLAKKYGIKTRIAHAHSTSTMSKGMLSKISGNILDRVLIKNANVYLACSESAAEWMFGKKITGQGKVHIIKNAIATDEFLYNQEWRDGLRMELNIRDKFVIGCIGRFVPLKRHDFLIDIFREIKKIRKDAALMLIGTGELEQQIKDKVKSLGLQDDVIFLGFRQDRNKWLSAMDCFALTSSFEGLGLVLIEAQASGLVSFAPKEAVPGEAKISPLLHFIDKDADATQWAKIITETEYPERRDMKKEVVESGYDMQSVMEQLFEIYSNAGLQKI